MKSFLILLTWLASFELQAKLVQILHTNDVHSHFEKYDEHNGVGGYAQLKSLIEQLKDDALLDGTPTLLLDAGDFLEGQLNFLSNSGGNSFEMMNLMGYDAVALGNHDWLMGTDGLEDMLTNMPMQFNFLGSNIAVDKKFTQINEKIKPYKIFNLGEHKLAIVGVTTDNPLYSWRIADGKITKPQKAAEKYAKQILKEKLADHIILLSHVGLKGDRKIADKTPQIDLIIGGHSHDALFKPEWIKSKNKKMIPVVQAGKHGQYLGRILIDLEPGQPLKIVDYQLIEIKNQPIDLEIAEHIQKTHDDLNLEYGEEWLNKVIGHSEVPLEVSEKSPTIWTSFITDAMRLAVNAQAGVHVKQFGGWSMPQGPINRKMLYNSYPRQFEFDQRYGWNIYLAELNGALIKTAVTIVVGANLPLYFSGISFDYHFKAGKLKLVKNIKINGELIEDNKNYTISFPEGIVRGGLGITSLVKLLLKNSQRTDQTIWGALEKHLANVSTITADYETNIENRYRPKDRDSGPLFERMMIPGELHGGYSE